MLGGEIASTFYAFHFPWYNPLFSPNNSGLTTMQAMTYSLLGIGLALYLSIWYRYWTRAESDKQNTVRVYLTQLLVHSISTWLFIPSLQLAFGAMMCNMELNMWHAPLESCGSSGHVSVFVPALLYLCTPVPLLCVAADLHPWCVKSTRFVTRNIRRRGFIRAWTCLFFSITSLLLFCSH